jgi:hypothetical protein
MSRIRFVHELVRSIHDEEQRKRRKARKPLRLSGRLRALHEFVEYIHDNPEVLREVKPAREAL